MFKQILLFYFVIFSTCLQGQLVSNKYFEVFDIAGTTFPAPLIYPIGDIYLVNPKTEGKSAYLVDEKGNRTELPCDHIYPTFRLNRDKKCYRCDKDSKSALFSMETKKPISKFYENITVISPQFYAVVENETAYLYNDKNELLYEKKIT